MKLSEKVESYGLTALLVTILALACSTGLHTTGVWLPRIRTASHCKRQTKHVDVRMAYEHAYERALNVDIKRLEIELIVSRVASAIRKAIK